MPTKRQTLAFYRKADVKGASDFASEFTGLSCPDVKTLGQRFRQLQHDPVAEALARRPRVKIPERVERANGLKNFLPVCFLELGMASARAVCKVETKGTDYLGRPDQQWHGTGFLVGRNLLLTNHHVLPSPASARDALCVFNYELGTSFSPLESVGLRLQPDRLFITSPVETGLDFTFVWIEDSANEKFGAIAMPRSAFTVHAGDYANVVQHPAGRRKEMVIQDNRVLQDTGMVLHYSSDTEEGSSGAPVFNNRWELIGLHRASRPNSEKLVPEKDLPPPAFLNEGVKISAIAADLERRAQAGEPQAATVLQTFSGVDSLMGFFGGLGRTAAPEAADDRQRVVDVYSGDAEDVDVAAWNAAWLNRDFEGKVGRAAATLADLNVDLWVLSECLPQAGQALVDTLNREYRLPYALHVGADAADGRPGTVAVWNKHMLKVAVQPWPDDVADWFTVRSTQFEDLELAAVPGPLFPRVPMLLRVDAVTRPPGAVPFTCHVATVQLGSSAEGAQRRHRALGVLGAALARAVPDEGGHDILVAGEFDAAVARSALTRASDGRAAVLAAGGDEGAIAYLRRRRSPLGRVYLSPTLPQTHGATDFFAMATGRQLPAHVTQLAQQKPVIVRLSLLKQPDAPAPLPGTLPDWLRVPAAVGGPVPARP